MIEHDWSWITGLVDCQALPNATDLWDSRCWPFYLERYVPRSRRDCEKGGGFIQLRWFQVCSADDLGCVSLKSFRVRCGTDDITRAELSRAEQSRAELAEPAERSRAQPSQPSVAKPSQAEPSRAEPSRAEPSPAEMSRAEPSRAEPSRAEPSRAVPNQPSETRTINKTCLGNYLILHIKPYNTQTSNTGSTKKYPTSDVLLERQGPSLSRSQQTSPARRQHGGRVSFD